MTMRSASTRTYHHHHLPPFHERLLFNGAVVLQVGLHALEQSGADLLVNHLSAPEPERDLGLVALRQELDEVAELDLIVTLFGARPEFHFLDLDLLLLASRRLSF